MKQAEKYMIVILNVFFLLVAVSFYSQIFLMRILEIIVLTGIAVVSFVVSKERDDLKFQMLCIDLFALTVWIAGILCEVSIKEKKILIMYGLFCLTFGTVYLLWKSFSSIRSKFHIMPYKGLILICVVFFVFSISTLGEVPIYDSGVYYSWSVENFAPNFDFTLDNILDYCLASHISVGYSLFVLLGELVSSQTTVGVHFINMILAELSIGAFYGILRKLFPGRSEITICLGTAVYAFAPAVLGLVGMINVDVPSIYFFVILFYCYVKQYRVLEFFLAWIFICTKEPNVIYYCFFILGVIVVNYIKKEKIVSSLAVYVLPMLYWFIYYSAPGRDSWVAGMSGLVNSTGLHTIGFTYTNLLIKLKEIFILNFCWIFGAIILLTGILWIFKKVKSTMEESLPLCTTLLGVLVFNFFYLDYPHPRYVIVGTGIVIMLGVICILLNYRNYLSNVFLLIVAILMFMQSFATIDPITRMCFTSIDRSDATTNLISSTRNGSYNDSSFYNREYMDYLGLLIRTLAEVEYDENTVLLFPFYENIPQGYGYSNNFLWDYEDGKIVVMESEHTIPVNIASTSESITGYARIIYLVPFFAETDNEILTRWNLGEAFKVDYRNMNLKYYIIYP